MYITYNSSQRRHPEALESSVSDPSRVLVSRVQQTIRKNITTNTTTNTTTTTTTTTNNDSNDDNDNNDNTTSNNQYYYIHDHQ